MKTVSAWLAAMTLGVGLALGAQAPAPKSIQADAQVRYEISDLTNLSRVITALETSTGHIDVPVSIADLNDLYALRTAQIQHWCKAHGVPATYQYDAKSGAWVVPAAIVKADKADKGSK